MVLKKKKKVKLRVFRYDPIEDLSPRYETFDVSYIPHMTVLDALMYVRKNLDSSLAFRYSCRQWVCGQCAVKVNGKPALICKTSIEDEEITVDPLTPFPVVRDLVVDRRKVQDRIKGIKPFLMRKNPAIKEPEPIDIKVADTFVHLNQCIDCYACVSACPMISTKKDVTDGFAGPVTMIKLAKFALDPRDEADRASAAYSEGAYSCTACAKCKEVCPWDIDIPTLGIRYLRQLLVERGDVPKTAQDALMNTYKYGNPWGQRKDRRGEWAKDFNVKNIPKGKNADILYYVGCTPSYDPRIQEVARAMVFVLREAGVDFGILGNEEMCCGAPMLRLGEKGLFDMLVEENLNLFEKYNVKKVVTTSPHSYNAFLNDYPKKGLRVQHYTQLLSELIDEGKINFSKKVDAVVTYHDPCFLGRYNDVYEPPRKILEAIPGLKLVEMPRNKENSFCCGGGGGMMWVDELGEERACVVRAREAVSVEPDVVATACPFCLSSLEDGFKIIDKEVPVKDIIELVKDAI